jgi:sulfate adenylyltransferase subunit 1
MKINGESRYKNLLRFTTAGSVDDGKSTLIGRLLYDSKLIFEDQMEHITLSGKRLGKEEMDLSLLTDGLRAEREQGITIDVAYRYFSTPARKFIIADTPGHIQYTRNMVTGASTADLAVILIDARKGVMEQTLRHTYIAHLLDIRHVVFCVNKMDMVEFSEKVFLQIRDELVKITERLGIEDVRYIPISAKYGDNVVDKSHNTDWYKGNTFLNIIETIEIKKDKNSHEARMPVQTIIRPLSDLYHDYRGYAGRIAGGTFNTSDKVIHLPSMLQTKIKSIDIYGKNQASASAGDSVSIILDDQIDVSRGDMIVKPDELPLSGRDINLMVCWFNEKPVVQGNKYIVRTNTNETYCRVDSLNYRVNVNTLDKETNITQAGMNEIVNIDIKSTKLIFYDTYKKNNITGSVIFIDEGTHETVGAGMIM